MDRTLSVNYPVLRQYKDVLLNRFKKPRLKDTTLYVHQYGKQEGIDR